MTDSLDTAVASLRAALAEIDDPVERYQTAKSLEEEIGFEIRQIKADAAKTLHDGRSWKQVGELLGVTGSRAEQISRGTR